MAGSAFTVHVINPKKTRRKKRSKKTGRKAAPAKKAAKKTVKAVPRRRNMAAKKKTTRRRKAAPAKRGAGPSRSIKRRRKNPSPAKRRRRSNPSMRGGLSAVTGEMKKALPRLMGMMATAWAVRRWGADGSSLLGPGTTSPTMGESWGARQYAVAGAVATFGPKLVGKWIDGNEFRRGAVDLIMQKLVWTEGLARTSWGQQQFGNAPGDIYSSPNGQAYVDQGGRYDAMQGLVERSPLDGLVESSPMDGDVSGYGHLLAPGTDPATIATGKYTGTGFVSPYQAAFSSR